MGLAKKVVHIKSRPYFFSGTISSTITMKTADYRKQQRTTQRDGEEEQESSPYCPETPKEREGKAKAILRMSRAEEAGLQGTRDAECRPL